MTPQPDSSAVLGQMPAWFRQTAFWKRLAVHMPPQQFARYLLVGAFNTLLGYSTFAALTRVLEPLGHQSYLLAMVLASIFNTTVAFFMHRRFAFRSKGNWRREYCCYIAVYASSMAVGFVVLPLTVTALRLVFGWERRAPYIAAAFLTIFGVIYNFIGNKRYSFRDAPPPPGASAPVEGVE
jgi:putative flippase GtrA